MFELVELTQAPERFFDLLPTDWREDIEPFWPQYAANSNIFGLADHGEIVAGGILFSTVSPDTQGYREIAQQWFDLGFRYIGFVFVKESRRNEGLGSRWLKEIQKRFPEQKFWLAIDEYGLARFYEKLGFKVVQEVKNGDDPEWILVEKS